MTLHHYYNKATDEVEYRFSVWPHYSYDTVPLSQWTEFLGLIIQAVVLNEESGRFKDLKVASTVVSPKTMAELGEYVSGRTSEEIHGANEKRSRSTNEQDHIPEGVIEDMSIDLLDDDDLRA